MIHFYLDILDRSKTGRSVNKTDWDMDFIVLPVRQLVGTYHLTRDKQNAVPDDPDLIDRLFQAGLELAAASGIYSISTGKVISFSQDELLEGIWLMPQRLQMGEGDDTRWLYARKIMDERPPIIWAGNPGAPTPEELFVPCVKSWMQEPIVDLATCGSITHVDGRTVETGSPMEIYATRWELRRLRETLQEVGQARHGFISRSERRHRTW